MNKKSLVVFLAIVFLVITIYYLIPGFNHLLVFNNHPQTYQLKHALLFFILFVIDIVFGRILINRDKEIKIPQES